MGWILDQKNLMRSLKIKKLMTKRLMKLKKSKVQHPHPNSEWLNKISLKKRTMRSTPIRTVLLLRNKFKSYSICKKKFRSKLSRFHKGGKRRRSRKIEKVVREVKNKNQNWGVRQRTFLKIMESKSLNSSRKRKSSLSEDSWRLVPSSHTKSSICN